MNRKRIINHSNRESLLKKLIEQVNRSSKSQHNLTVDSKRNEHQKVKNGPHLRSLQK